MEWYVLFVQTGKEEMVQKSLRYFFDESFLQPFVPKRLLPEKRLGKLEYTSKTLFPGYVFIKTNMDQSLYHKLKNVPGYYRVLGNGSQFSAVTDEEMAVINELTRHSETVDISRIYLINSRVVVKSGPLQGLEGIIHKVDPRKRRAKILLNLAGEPKIVDVGIEVITKTVNAYYYTLPWFE
ncbi:MAG: antiterminator LoaP [Peptococcaceae bacterium]|jgi:transcriptional antiterminator NusG|nr:antiterminator LoaP [Peptococcaceae bacterium]MDH7525571.1 antiterminator LoaP [Peptococcaceae bacterium]